MQPVEQAEDFAETILRHTDTVVSDLDQPPALATVLLKSMTGARSAARNFTTICRPSARRHRGVSAIRAVEN